MITQNTNNRPEARGQRPELNNRPEARGKRLELTLRPSASGLWPIPRRTGFTLAEILVVMGIVAMTMSIVLPSAMALFSTGTDVAARTTVSGMLGTARSLAVENLSYTAVHVQIGVDNECWVGVLKGNYNNGNLLFKTADGFPMRALPGHMALGQVSSDWVTGADYKAIGDDSTSGASAGRADKLPDRRFTTFNIVFAPDGSLYLPQTGGITIDTANSLAFSSVTGKQKIWHYPNDPLKVNNKSVSLTSSDLGKVVQAFCVFDYRAACLLSDRVGGANGLNKTAQFLALNPTTGTLIPYKR